MQGRTGSNRSFRIRPSSVTGLLVTLCVVTACSSTAPPASQEPATATPPSKSLSDSGELITLPSGRDVYLECRGQGEPTVVFISGGGLAADEWSTLAPGSVETPVMDQMAMTNRVCAYDRPGTTRVTGESSRSTPVKLPRTLTEMSQELGDVLTAGHENGPYVVVGHSFGSPIGRLYAGMNPDDVVGMVWVDGGHEVFYQVFENLIGPAGFNIPGVEYYLPTTLDEMFEQFAAHPVPAVPSVIIEHSRDRERFPNPMKWDPSWPVAQLEDEWQKGQDQLSALVPGSSRIVADNSDHLIMVEEPALVIAAIQQVIAADAAPMTPTSGA